MNQLANRINFVDYQRCKITATKKKSNTKFCVCLRVHVGFEFEIIEQNIDHCAVKRKKQQIFEHSVYNSKNKRSFNRQYNFYFEIKKKLPKNVKTFQSSWFRIDRKAIFKQYLKSNEHEGFVQCTLLTSNYIQSWQLYFT